jgi:FMN phosphatase YigB (HAD superfamily)
MKKKTVVFDLDGTLADISHRTHLVQSEHPDWDAFYSLIPGDDLNAWCKELMDAMCDRHEVVIVSGRPKRCMKDTKEWLEKFEVPYNKLYLVREDKDYSPDQELKKKWLNGYGKNKVLFVVDDRTRVVDMWRAEGVVCLQAYRWEEFKKEKKDG